MNFGKSISDFAHRESPFSKTGGLSPSSLGSDYSEQEVESIIFDANFDLKGKRNKFLSRSRSLSSISCDTTEDLFCRPTFGRSRPMSCRPGSNGSRKSPRLFDHCSPSGLSLTNRVWSPLSSVQEEVRLEGEGVMLSEKMFGSGMKASKNSPMATLPGFFNPSTLVNTPRNRSGSFVDMCDDSETASHTADTKIAALNDNDNSTAQQVDRSPFTLQNKNLSVFSPFASSSPPDSFESYEIGERRGLCAPPGISPPNRHRCFENNFYSQSGCHRPPREPFSLNFKCSDFSKRSQTHHLKASNLIPENAAKSFSYEGNSVAVGNDNGDENLIPPQSPSVSTSRRFAQTGSSFPASKLLESLSLSTPEGARTCNISGDDVSDWGVSEPASSSELEVFMQVFRDNVADVTTASSHVNHGVFYPFSSAFGLKP